MLIRTARATALALAAAALAVSGLASCASQSAPGTAGSGVQAGRPGPQLVTARPVGGSPGHGPAVVISPPAAPNGSTRSQQIVLGGRTLIVSSVSTRPGKSPRSILIGLAIVVRNTGTKAIANKPGFFELVAASGDSFTVQQHGSAGFYGTIAARAARAGTIVFQIPAAARQGIFLLYRPSSGLQSVLTKLQ